MLATLNTEQRAAATSPAHLPLLLCAGPGSGKTRVLTSRVLWLLQEQHHHQPPVHHVLAVSFSRASCQTFQQRLATVLSPLELSTVKVCTFHSLCLRLCRQHPTLLGLGAVATFRLCSTSEQIAYVVEILTDLKLKPVNSGSRHNPADLVARIDRAKSTLVGPEDFDDQPTFQRVFQLFNRKMTHDCSLSFLDVIVKTLHLLSTHPQLLHQFQQVRPGSAVISYP